jgi:hypothetical protein
VLVTNFRRAQNRKRRLKLAMAAGVSRNDANKVLWMEKTINQCFERHNREARLKEEMQRGRKVL